MDRPVLHWTVYNQADKKLMFAYAYSQVFIIRGVKYIVPAGMWFDGASVPRFLWSIFSPTGKAMVAASLHDLLYITQGKGINNEYNLTRKQVDDIFLWHMLDTGVPKLQAYMMYRAVRVFGKTWWDEKDEVVIYIPENMPLDVHLRIAA